MFNHVSKWNDEQILAWNRLGIPSASIECQSRQGTLFRAAHRTESLLLRMSTNEKSSKRKKRCTRLRRIICFLRSNTILPIPLNMLAMPTRRFVKHSWLTTTKATKSKVSSPSALRTLHPKTSANCTRSIRSKCSVVDNLARFTEVNLSLSLSCLRRCWSSLVCRPFVGNERTSGDQSDR